MSQDKELLLTRRKSCPRGRRCRRWVRTARSSGIPQVPLPRQWSITALLVSCFNFSTTRRAFREIPIIRENVLRRHVNAEGAEVTERNVYKCNAEADRRSRWRVFRGIVAAQLCLVRVAHVPIYSPRVVLVQFSCTAASVNRSRSQSTPPWGPQAPRRTMDWDKYTCPSTDYLFFSRCNFISCWTCHRESGHQSLQSAATSN